MQNLLLIFLLMSSTSLLAQHENIDQSPEVYRAAKVRYRHCEYSFIGGISRTTDEFREDGNKIRSVHFDDKGNPRIITTFIYTDTLLTGEQIIRMDQFFFFKRDTQNIVVETYYDSSGRITGTDKTSDGKLIYQKLYSYEPYEEREYYYEIKPRKITTHFEKPRVEASQKILFLQSETITFATNVNYKNKFNEDGTLKKRIQNIERFSYLHREKIRSSSAIHYRYTNNGLYHRINYREGYFRKFTYEYY